MVDVNTLYTKEEKEQIDAFNDTVTDLENELQDLYLELSDLRKEGRDCLVAEFNYRNIRSKISYIRSSLDQNEIVKFKQRIVELKKDLEDVKKQEIINVKKEIERRLNEEGADYIGKTADEE